MSSGRGVPAISRTPADLRLGSLKATRTRTGYSPTRHGNFGTTPQDIVRSGSGKVQVRVSAGGERRPLEQGSDACEEHDEADNAEHE